jgi:hypothetical protein
MTIEKDIHELCVLFQIKWQNFMNPENVLEQSKPEFIEDSRLVFSLLYNHFGSEEALNEIDECLQEDPDSQPDPDIDEYLIFVENLNIARNMTEHDYDEPNSKMSRTLAESIRYIQKKNDELAEFTNTMKNLNNTLNDLGSALLTLAEDKPLKHN